MITRERDGPLTTITLDRPQTRNALRRRDPRALDEHLKESSTPVVYLTVVNGAFCSGADFDTIASLESTEAARSFARLGQQVATTIETIDAVVIAGIDGPARGGGVELALACDIRVATPQASFAETGVTIGLFGAWGGTHRLPAVVGLGPALDIALTGRVIGPDEARRIGLVTGVVDEPMELVRSVANNDAGALSALKQRMRDDAPIPRREQAEARAFAELITRGPSLPD